MCGIVGYAGERPAVEIVMDGLRRLEYRGYDSAGVAVLDGGELWTAKRAGKLVHLEKALAEGFPDGPAGIGHTRWATHGGPTDRNAHPHVAGRVAVIHNGIIENFARLRASLAVDLVSETDTEVAAHLLSGALAAVRQEGVTGPQALAEAMRRVSRQLEGAFTLLAVDADTPGAVVGARRNSPLVVGRGQGENFLASDVSAFIEHTRDAIELGQDQVVLITPGAIEITNFDGSASSGTDYRIDWDLSAAEKGGHDYFMLKEIAEQPRAVADTLRGRLLANGDVDLDLGDLDLSDVEKIVIVACGTAYHSGLVARYAIEQWARIPCEVEMASEFRYRDPIVARNTLVVAISQSGETMDTLMALRHARGQGARVLAICNTNGSTIARESDAVVYTHGGPEIAVASTKAFLTQLTACYLLALRLAPAAAPEVARRLLALPSQLTGLLETMDPVRKLARDLSSAPQVLFIGRHVGFPVALEGALKLKELAYMHAEGFAAGELKHGPIALIDDATPVICVLPSPGGVLHDKVVSNIQEVRARGARTIVIAEDGDESARPYADALITVPPTAALLAPLLTTVPLQILACEIAAARGHDVDQPRNLAKSVTVE
ncbi:glutamine--fructose-6-phosphate transaminase (isomerizing) [Actinoplanes sp. CA-054009]